MYLGHGLDLSRSRDVIGHVTILSAVCGFIYSRWSVDTFFLAGTVTEIFRCKVLCKARLHYFGGHLGFCHQEGHQVIL